MKLGRMWIIAAGLATVSFAASNTAIIDAVKNGDQAQFQSLLKQKADVNAAEPDGTTALHYAAHNGDLATVDALLKAGAKATAANRYGVTPLAEAMVKGNAVMVEKLLKAGADPNTLTTPEGETVLMTAARAGNAAAVKVLLDHGANVNARENYMGQTALMWAAAEGHPDVIKLLLAKNADMTVRSFDRDTTLPKLTAGSPVAPINRGGLTALLFAARQGEIESIKAMLDAGADINQVDVDKNNALNLAILNTHYDLANFLLERGADPNIANKDGRAALFAAVDMKDAEYSPRPAHKERDKMSSMDLIESLIAHKANVNQQLTSASEIHRFAQDHGDKTLAAGATSLMRAAKGGDADLMKYLVSKGADPKLANKDGMNILLLSAGLGGGRPGVEETSSSLQESQHLAAVKYSLELGMDVNAPDDKKDTALHGAAQKGWNTVVQYLADKGATLDAKNKAGFTALDLANGKGGFGGAPRDPKPETVALLKDLMGKSGKTTAAENKDEPKKEQPK